MVNIKELLYEIFFLVFFSFIVVVLFYGYRETYECPLTYSCEDLRIGLFFEKKLRELNTSWSHYIKLTEKCVPKYRLHYDSVCKENLTK